MRSGMLAGLSFVLAGASGCALQESLVDGVYGGISGVVAGVIEMLVFGGGA